DATSSSGSGAMLFTVDPVAVASIASVACAPRTTSTTAAPISESPSVTVMLPGDSCAVDRATISWTNRRPSATWSICRAPTSSTISVHESPSTAAGLPAGLPSQHEIMISRSPASCAGTCTLLDVPADVDSCGVPTATTCGNAISEHPRELRRVRRGAAGQRRRQRQTDGGVRARLELETAVAGGGEVLELCERHRLGGGGLPPLRLPSGDRAVIPVPDRLPEAGVGERAAVESQQDHRRRRRAVPAVPPEHVLVHRVADRARRAG